MKKPSSILRSLSTFRPASTSSPQWLASRIVAPLPTQSPFDQRMAVHLHNMNQQMGQLQEEYSSNTNSTTTWLLSLLDATIVSQKLAQGYLPLDLKNRNDLRRKEAIDLYLEENIQLLDSCNVLSEQMETIRKYTGSLRAAIHLLDQRSLASASRARVLSLLDTRKLGFWSKTSRPNIRKLATAVHSCAGNVGESDRVVEEALSGSKSLAAFTVYLLLESALSTKKPKKNPTFPVTKSRPTTAWSTALLHLQNSVRESAEKKQLKKGSNFFMVPELRDMVVEARSLRDRVAEASDRGDGTIRIGVEGLRRSCDALEQGVLGEFERRVKELYKQLISVRMALL